ncbi:hypothetical protein EJ06DRAFT_544087 [Trichodelitschia bisporula]|uniref:HAD-like protein n=1 Tax=Trichodelitschia bisporula TaxID=703511 RepID=A0A6G1HQU0_9PEZI|nr:hypothetical protein EJ06DRAFT_544087 [Trichodelitschia bisporula]
MQSTNRARKSLLIGLDAFGTLFSPRRPIAVQYGEIARRHGLGGFSDDELSTSFKRGIMPIHSEGQGYQGARTSVGMNAPTWWGNVITKTFQPFLQSGNLLPKQIIPDLIERFSSAEGYFIYPDVLPFFHALRSLKNNHDMSKTWDWEKTVVGIITNSDDRVPDILAGFGLSVGPRRVGNKEDRRAEEHVDADVSFVVLSYDVGYEKPHCQVFRAAEELLHEGLGASKEDHEDFVKVYIGDDLEKDALAATAAGWQGLYLDREGKFKNRDFEEPKGETGPVDVIKDLRAVMSLRPT